MSEQERKDPRERSVSGDYESEFDGSQRDDGSNTQGTPGANPPGKPGRKKNPNSQAARRDQNRIAQREFRLRKQQRIRDLEARVEILSGGKEEAIGEMRNILKDLMAENHNLRQMLRSLATFIGEGMGGVLPKLGWDENDWNNMLNKGETDTAWEGYQRRKKQAEQNKASAASSPMSTMASQKRPSEDASLGTRPKKARSENETPNGFNLMGSMGSGNMFPSDSDRNGMFPELMRGGPSQPMFPPPPGPSSSSLPYGGMSNNLDYPGAYLGLPMNHQPMPPYEPTNVASSQARIPPPEEEDIDDEPNKLEAHKLIQYHLENYKRNPGYCLPSSLRPTNVQRTIPHPSVIDGVIHPELRDRMILLREKYDLVDCLLDFRRNTTIHGDDVLAHSNWEVAEPFFRKYPFLAEAATIVISNRWRKERGEPELRITDFAEPAA
ncbi:hypothetical protein CC1G_01258 [Coprinopsis cinerea okayama7|uniref:BZIP domain-containing protein n=1 Tax=Coprinopsis cinerea (strain Okayama-7 / 130 / ATCC MYA-4618 / FGSC 9003) TaxID=240176 RepID=A8NY53_COPC7|nr:hypothetical protein CC1G_01258 [Coprinopsis cinerea okayama7\|eukprot:XP_001837346.2 hypothetical protein CC1G_01258 [Coprinopsis cinerea okayama7\